MIECPHCKEFVEMIDDSGIATDTDVYSIYLECPECHYRIIGKAQVSEFELLPPLE